MLTATKQQILWLLHDDPLVLVDAIGIDYDDMEMSMSVESPKLKISVRNGTRYKVPEQISVIIDGEELLVDFQVSEDLQTLADFCTIR